MATIEVDFEVFKALTALRESEDVSENDVIRRLLGIVPQMVEGGETVAGGCLFLGVYFPDGTDFGVTYKGQNYTAKIIDGRWVGWDGEIRSSPSDAARAITGNNVNGWRFWHVKRPHDSAWKRMDELR